jgi:hypothetical protein
MQAMLDSESEQLSQARRQVCQLTAALASARRKVEMSDQAIERAAMREKELVEKCVRMEGQLAGALQDAQRLDDAGAT